ncbi:MAG: hypothetical protein OEY89_12755 [Gammaproteobacteria bacterium]|nr:hypothetical protein [Gammaproteobacteria bacterium]
METTSILNQSLAAIVCATLFVCTSYLVNRKLARPVFTVDLYLALLYATTVFLLAITAEVIVNTIYHYFVGEKLWVYHVMPVYHQDVSLLAPLLWSAYGIHLYFVEQTYQYRLPRLMKHKNASALLHGLDAPLIFETSGNLIFLLIAGSYYAYYIPGDLFHLTSVRVIPLYMLCIFLGLVILRWLENQSRHWSIPAGIFSLGMGILYIA